MAGKRRGGDGFSITRVLRHFDLNVQLVRTAADPVQLYRKSSMISEPQRGRVRMDGRLIGARLAFSLVVDSRSSCI